MRKLQRQILLLMGFILVLTSFFSNETYAINSNSIVANISDYDILSQKVDLSKEYKFTYWKISDEYLTKEKTDEIYDKLINLTDEKISEKYQRFDQNIKFQDNKLVIEGIGKGTFFAKHLLKTDYLTVTVLNTFTFLERLPHVLEINSKLEIEDEAKVKLVKIDQDNKRLEGVEFKLYKIENGKEVLIKFDGLGKVTDSPNGIDTLKTDSNGCIQVNGLKLGDYIFRETKTLPGYKIINKDTKFKLIDSRELVVTVINEKERVGNYNFLKVADDKQKTPLKGAEFKVTYMKGDKEVTLQRQGKDLILISDENGMFRLENIPYGDYKLWEIKAPSGYIKLKDSIEFTVSEKSGEDNLGMVIVNKENPDNPPKTPPKTPPRKPTRTPKTGDIAMGGLAAVGFTSLIGLYIVNKRKNQKED